MHTSRSGKPRVIITTGDPSGIGPEVTQKALASPKVKRLADFLVIGDTKTSVGSRKSPDICGKLSMQYLDRALRIIAKGEADCLVTAPINKANVRAAGFKNFEGHTEYLAEETLTKEYAMMFVGKRLKITLVTRHVALKDVSARLTADKISTAIGLTHRYLSDHFHLKDPKIAVAGLNPHAGEGGIFGKEEVEVISPAIKVASRSCGKVFGPFPPDVVFGDALAGKFDAVIAMYHDQGLIPFKLLYFKDGINMTIGLPFVRTSPDHGTAFDIAGKGIADPSSMIEAIRLAVRLAHHS
ncbi:MAG: 4-hydroxythreonine-4-phosphate dehydrogenase PdxA [Candidatus Omnitrophica bacterium]|nr:4-hydroxythreonine-4-phosphate dehydrogenase PdxA [Candidatus Omnitrophota bacterium]